MDLSKCKVCGYVMETGKVGAVCPACGVPSKVFEPYKPTMSEDRYKILSLHIHPIVLHFPQAFVITATGLLFLALIFTGELQTQIITVIQFNLLFLPLTVIMGAASGIKDGQLRFKKLSPPALQLKIKLSIGFLILSILTAALVFILPLTMMNLILLLVLCAVQSLLAVVLGKTGSKLIDSFVPGK